MQLIAHIWQVVVRMECVWLHPFTLGAFNVVKRCFGRMILFEYVKPCLNLVNVRGSRRRTVVANMRWYTGTMNYGPRFVPVATPSGSGCASA